MAGAILHASLVALHLILFRVASSVVGGDDLSIALRLHSDDDDGALHEPHLEHQKIWGWGGRGRGRLCSVREFGAAGNGEDFDTVAIQAAIDACAGGSGRSGRGAGGEGGRGGRGVVHFPPGRYLTGTIFLRSNIRVDVGRGATILGSPYQRDYPSQSERWFVILAEDSENVELTGGGTVDGQGLQFVAKFDDRKNVMVSWNTSGDCYGDECRPRLVGFLNCKRVHVWDVYLREPAYWCLNVFNCNDVLIENVRIYGDFNSPNNDGIDIDGSNNTVIAGCHINTGDDAICPKTVGGPVFNLTVSDCWIRTKSAGIKLGSASSFSFHGLRFERLKIVDSHRGLALQLRDSGNISDVTFANVEISTQYYDSSWWGRAEPIYVAACPRNASTIVGFITDVHFVNISSTSENGIFLAGSQGSMLTNIFFENVSMEYVNLGTSPEITHHDYRPGCRGLVVHQSSGLFIEHASNISFTNVGFGWAPNVNWNVPLDVIPKTVGNLRLVDFTSLARLT